MPECSEHHACACIQEKLWKQERLVAEIRKRLNDLWDQCFDSTNHPIQSISAHAVIDWVNKADVLVGKEKHKL